VADFKTILRRPGQSPGSLLHLQDDAKAEDQAMVAEKKIGAFTMHHEKLMRCKSSDV
jgi:hypothetical protein